MKNHEVEMMLKNAYARKISEHQCEQIYCACLEILERTGVRLYDQEALDLVKKAGLLPTDGNRVRIPAGMVEKALSTVPKRLTLYNRNGDPCIRLEGRRSYFGGGSECLYLIDHRTGERREPVLQDIIDGAIVSDALPNVDFLMSMFTPHDLPPNLVNQVQMEIMLNYSTKPVVFIGSDFPSCKDAVEMAEAVAGGGEALRRHPMVVCYINVTTGLRHNKESLQRLLYMSDKGLPVAYVPSGQGGTTAPITLAGNMIIPLAGSFVGIVLSQLKREGAPFIMPGWAGSSIDMRTMIQPYCDPEKRGVAIDFAHYLGLPIFSLGGCSDSKLVDEQAAAEVVLTLFSEILFGGHMVHDLGYLESGQAYSLALLVIADEIISWLKAFVKGVEVSDNTLAVDLIDTLGPDGQYIDSNHTFENFRSRWYPNLLDRSNRRLWLAKGGKSMGQRAADRVTEILDTHKPVPLPEKAAAAVSGIVERARTRSGCHDV